MVEKSSESESKSIPVWQRVENVALITSLIAVEDYLLYQRGHDFTLKENLALITMEIGALLSVNSFRVASDINQKNKAGYPLGIAAVLSSVGFGLSVPEFAQVALPTLGFTAIALSIDYIRDRVKKLKSENQKYKQQSKEAFEVTGEQFKSKLMLELLARSLKDVDVARCGKNGWIVRKSGSESFEPMNAEQFQKYENEMSNSDTPLVKIEKDLGNKANADVKISRSVFGKLQDGPDGLPAFMRMSVFGECYEIVRSKNQDGEIGVQYSKPR